MVEASPGWSGITLVGSKLVAAPHTVGSVLVVSLPGCEAPVVMNATVPSCIEGAFIEDGGVCTPSCLGFMPSVDSVTIDVHGKIDYFTDSL